MKSLRAIRNEAVCMAGSQYRSLRRYIAKRSLESELASIVRTVGGHISQRLAAPIGPAQAQRSKGRREARGIHFGAGGIAALEDGFGLAIGFGGAAVFKGLHQARARDLGVSGCAQIHCGQQVQIGRHEL